MAEYDRMNRERQSEIKDVGGFVGGYCRNGKRQNVVSRSLLTLDADFADQGLWADWMMSHGEAACIYSTHKHRPDSPRLRMIVPLSRDVDPEEWQEKSPAERHIWASIPQLDTDGLVPQHEISVAELWCDALGRPRDRLDRAAVKSVQAAMLRIGGWELSEGKSYRGAEYGSQRVWVRK